MHERGVCGCDVKFPALQQPRMLTRPVLGNGHGVEGNGNTKVGKIEDGNIKDENIKGEPTKDSNDEIDTVSTLEDDSSENSGRRNEESNTVQALTRSISITSLGNQQNGSSESHFDASIKSGIDKAQINSSQHNQGDNEDLRPKINDILRDNSLKFGPKKNNNNHNTNSNKKKNNKSKKQYNKNKKKPAPHPRRHALAWNVSDISPFYEVHDENGGSIDVAVRLSSQYGAEWIQDHARVHEAGHCNCAVQFETYTPHLFTASDMAMYGPSQGSMAPGYQMGTGEGADVAKHSLPELRDMDITIWQMNDTDMCGRMITWPTKPQDYGFHSADEAKAWLDSQRLGERTSYPNGAAILPGATTEMRGYTDTESLEGQTGCNAPHLPYPKIAHGQPPAIPTTNPYSAVYDNQQPSSETHHMNNGIPAAATMQEQSNDLENIVPLVGWPLGAGPEGDSHSQAWDMCRLSRPRPTRAHSFSG
jgi:hypothetical protein